MHSRKPGSGGLSYDRPLLQSGQDEDEDEYSGSKVGWGIAMCLAFALAITGVIVGSIALSGVQQIQNTPLATPPLPTPAPPIVSEPPNEFLEQFDGLTARTSSLESAYHEVISVVNGLLRGHKDDNNDDGVIDVDDDDGNMKPCNTDAECDGQAPACRVYKCIQATPFPFTDPCCVLLLADEGAECTTGSGIDGLCDEHGDCQVDSGNCLARLQDEKSIDKQLATKLQGLHEAEAEYYVPSAIGWTHGVGYQIQTPGFYNGGCVNADFGVGDVCGIEHQLDYLDDLGIEYIWLTQPNDAVEFFGFDVVDHKTINPRWGSNDEFFSLVCAAHARNIKIQIGATFHQVSVEHPFFQSVLDGESDYLDLFLISDDPPIAGGVFDGGDGLWLNFAEEFPLRTISQNPNLFYRSKFGDIYADLNIGHDKVVDYAVDIIEFWASRGVDGFRFDATFASGMSDVNEDGNDVSELETSRVFYRNLTRQVRQNHPSVHLVAENDRQQSAGIAMGAWTVHQINDVFQKFAVGRNGQVFLDEFAVEFRSSLHLTSVLQFGNHDSTRMLSKQIWNSLDEDGEQQSPITITTDAPGSYEAAPPGVFRLHYEEASLFPALKNGNIRMYYYAGHEYEDPVERYNSSPWPLGGPLPTDAAGVQYPSEADYDRPKFLGNNLGGDGMDDFGPYWDFNITLLPNDQPGYLGFIVIHPDTSAKISGDIQPDFADYFPLTIAGKGDMFIRGLGISGTPPTDEEYGAYKGIFAALLTLPGTPQIWQGDEFGMVSSPDTEGIGDSTREALVWTGAGQQVTHFNPYNLFPEIGESGAALGGYTNQFSTIATVIPPSVQLMDPDSLLTYVRNLTRYRRRSDAVRNGAYIRTRLPGEPENDALSFYDADDPDNITVDDLLVFERHTEFPVYTVINRGIEKILEYRPQMLRRYDVKLNTLIQIFEQFWYASSRLPEIIAIHNVTIMDRSDTVCKSIRNPCINDGDCDLDLCNVTATKCTITNADCEIDADCTGISENSCIVDVCSPIRFLMGRESSIVFNTMTARGLDSSRSEQRDICEPPIDEFLPGPAQPGDAPPEPEVLGLLSGSGSGSVYDGFQVLRQTTSPYGEAHFPGDPNVRYA